MILATDVQYSESTATAAGILFTHWQSEQAYSQVVTHIDTVESYEPGLFYKRELPCLLALLTKVDTQLSAIVVDGYVSLGRRNRPGLGMYLYNALDQRVPVIGVAKNKFENTPVVCEILRGHSQKPLFITAVGISLEVAKASIEKMHGEHRIPTLLKAVDQLCRGII